ncbi:MAG TPA: Rrf2 family transcriptional regulator [Bryobacteraceae bacterium]|nr:Rrf2 family transcriptional regulator [Bryobacteraceae bacterium]
MLSQTAEYALRAMVSLARGGSHTAQDVAADARVPLDYLSKILNALGRAGLVSAQRGRGGGFQAARSADEISVLEVVTAVDPVRRIHTCPLGLAAHGTNLCPLHRKIDDAAQSIEEMFRLTTIGSLAGVPFCAGEEHCVAAR